MRRTHFVVTIAAIAFVLAACQGGVADQTGSPAPSTSPAGSPVASPSSSPDETPETSPNATAEPTPEATPGETRTIPFRPAGAPELNGEITLTEMGRSTEVAIEFENLELPSSTAVARLLVGTCDGSNQMAGELELSGDRIEGLVPLSLDSILGLPHAVAIYESDDEDGPLACADLPQVEAEPSPTSS